MGCFYLPHCPGSLISPQTSVRRKKWCDDDNDDMVIMMGAVSSDDHVPHLVKGAEMGPAVTEIFSFFV